MKKIICIGELSINMVLDASGQPLGALPGSRVANAAAILGRDKFNVIMASDAASDPMGDIAVRALTDAGVDISAVDRFTEGRTPLNVFVGHRPTTRAPLPATNSIPRSASTSYGHGSTKTTWLYSAASTPSIAACVPACSAFWRTP